MLMENFLRSKEYWQVVESRIDEPTKDAKKNLFQAMDRSILETILSKETSKEIWDSMKKNGESVTDYFARTMEVSNKMRFYGEKMEDITIVEKVLCSLTLKFDYTVCFIEESKDIDALSLDELQSSLLLHEQKMNRSSTTKDQTLKASTSIHSTNFSCSNHLCVSKSSFSFLNEDFNSTVSFGDCYTVNVMGKGDVKIKTKNGFVETISNLLYVPSLKSDLLSAGQLQEKGYVITIKNSSCEIYDPIRGAIAIVPMNSNKLFALKIENIQSCLMTKLKDPSWLWHFRYGHLSFAGLRTLQQKNMNEAGKTIKTLRIDWELTTSYTPQQNGVSERKNRTILNLQPTPIILDSDANQEAQPAEISSNA
ncbi:hypothetical protein K2173_010186 [Erythroxylum novogranatense]|uniref:GAG-pre-integrase domain-containing protein n=1 Tax=Erythroxylum novogranatense TaxID=1862640 RepID=A0AAV8S758_9ROSI|nr:hypothetical protein K2173_010186 [Erythroxylum novogranatense]